MNWCKTLIKLGLEREDDEWVAERKNLYHTDPHELCAWREADPRNEEAYQKLMEYINEDARENGSQKYQDFLRMWRKNNYPPVAVKKETAVKKEMAEEAALKADNQGTASKKSSQEVAPMMDNQEEAENKKNWRNIIEKNKRREKNFGTIFAFQKVVGDVRLLAEGDGGEMYALCLKSDFHKLCTLPNRKLYAPLWQRVTVNNGAEEKKEMWTRFVGVKGRKGLEFPAVPTYTIEINEKEVYYLWKFDRSMGESMLESLDLTAKTLAYLAPGAKALDYSVEGAAYVAVPGIPALNTGKPGTLEKTGPFYTYAGLWDILRQRVPVCGKSLRKFLNSESLYLPGLHTTREFLGIIRFNKLLKFAAKLSKKEFAKIKRDFLFWAHCFGNDCGMTDTQVEAKLADFGMRRNVDVFGREMEECRAVRSYMVKDTTLVKIFGEAAKKYFSYEAPERKPMDEIHAETMESRRKVISLANQGFKIREIAEKLGLTMSTVKRHRSIGVKEGLITKAAVKAAKAARAAKEALSGILSGTGAEAEAGAAMEAMAA